MSRARGLAALAGGLLLVLLAALALPATQALRRWLLFVTHAPAEWLYLPRERLAGGGEPPAPRTDPGQESLDPQLLSRAVEYAGRIGSDALLVSRNGHLVLEAYWHGSGFDSLRDAQSLPRLLTDLAVGAAIGQHRFTSTGQSVGELLPEWRADARGRIALADLLHGRSGLQLAGALADPRSLAARERFGTSLRAAVLAHAGELTPGSRWSGDDIDAEVLGLALAQASSRSYADFVSVALWRRLGAADAWLWLDRRGGVPHAACCMLARQGDWIRVAELLLGDGNYRGDEVLRPGWIARLREPAPGDGGGWFVPLDVVPGPAREPWPERDVLEVASAGGHRIWALPALHLAVVRLGGPPQDEHWDEARLPGLIAAAVRTAPQPRGGDLDLSTIVPHH